MGRGGLAHWCFIKYRQDYDSPKVRLDTKIRILLANALEVPLQGYSTWALLDSHDAKFKACHCGLFVRCLRIYNRKASTNHSLSDRAALERTRCESTEMTVKKRQLRFLGNVLRIGANACRSSSWARILTEEYRAGAGLRGNGHSASSRVSTTLASRSQCGKRMQKLSPLVTYVHETQTR